MYIPYEIDEIAELTATGIMGWTLDKEYGFWETGDGDLDVESEWNPSAVEKDTEILINKIANDKNMKIFIFSHDEPKMTQATFYKKDRNAPFNEQYHGFDSDIHKAICKAALKVYGLKLG